MLLLIVLGSFVGLSSCLKPKAPDIDQTCLWNCDTLAPTRIVWKSEFEEEPVGSISMEPRITDSVVVFSNKFYKGNPEIFRGYNRFNGNLKWSWLFPHNEEGDRYVSASSRNKYIVHDQMIFSIATYYYNLDVNQATVNASRRILDFAQGPRINVINNKVYFTMGTWPRSDTTVYLCSTDLMFTTVDTLAKHVHKEGEVEPSISLEPPSFWVRPDGDTIAVYVLRGYALPNQNWYEIHALNLSKKTENGYKELWMRDSFPYDDNCNVITEPIFYRDSLLIFPGQSAVYGISLQTGELIYSTPIPEDLLTTDFILVGDRVIFVDNPGNLHILDAGTGDILGIIPDCGGNVSNMVHHNGIVYYTSGRLYAIDVEKKEVIWRWKSPHIKEQGYAQFTFAGVAIDRENGWLYTSDRVYAMCVELVE